ncbi:MAG: MarR family transcriptional regulator [Candidatus Sumerlaeales bacterium]|nr:MarR family transcriptional regulator [Candidatus Sumerlaeales bacterium]
MTTKKHSPTSTGNTAQNLIATADMLRKEYNILLHPLAINDSQVKILNILMNSDNEANAGVPQIVISNILGVHRSNITAMIRKMEKAGWVARHSANNNKKTKFVALTPAGRKIATNANAVYQSCIQRILDGISDAEQQQLNEILSHLQRQLNV